MRALVHTFILLACFTAPLYAAPASIVPLTIKGKAITIGSSADRASIATTLKGVFKKEAPSVSLPDFLQYDFSAVEGQGPVSLNFKFDTRGMWTEIDIFAYMKEQNPVAQQLVGWLTKKVGKGKKNGKKTTWKYEGLVYRLEEVKDSGDESAYSMNISKIR